MSLFEPDPPKDKPKPKNTCQQCIHLFEHNYNASMKYCGKQPSKRTGTGFKKIKSRDAACPMFEKYIK